MSIQITSVQSMIFDCKHSINCLKNNSYTILKIVGNTNISLVKHCQYKQDLKVILKHLCSFSMVFTGNNKIKTMRDWRLINYIFTIVNIER